MQGLYTLHLLPANTAFNTETQYILLHDAKLALERARDIGGKGYVTRNKDGALMLDAQASETTLAKE